MPRPRIRCCQRPTHSAVAGSHLALIGPVPSATSVGPASRPPAPARCHHAGVPSRFAFPVPVTAGARWFVALMRCPRNSTPVMSISRRSLRCPRTLPLSDFLCLFILLREGRVVGSRHGHRAVLRDDWGNPLAPMPICPCGRTRVLLGAPSPSPPCGHIFLCLRRTRSVSFLSLVCLEHVCFAPVLDRINARGHGF